MNVGRFAVRVGYSLIGALMLVGLCAPPALAQDHGGQALTSQHHGSNGDQKNQSGELVNLSGSRPSASVTSRWPRRKGTPCSLAV
jgi:hypothetical protein